MTERQSKDQVTRREFVGKSVVAATGLAVGAHAQALGDDEKKKIRNYNENMLYRPCGKTGMMISAICMGGHWKRIDKMVPGLFKGRGWLSADVQNKGFEKNRYDVVSRLIEVGINYIDACTVEEVFTYGRALKGRRDKMFLGCSWYQREMRKKGYRTKKALLETLDRGLKETGIEYADLWRITMHSKSSKHTEGEVEQMMMALETAKKQGKVLHTGLSSHDRPHIKWMIETYPEIVECVVTPYTAKSKELPKDSLFATLKEHKVGCFGIKPFASNSLFKGDGSPDSPEAEADSKRARLALRYIMCNPAITAPIPGLINTTQVDNAAAAVKEPLALNATERAELETAMNEAWDNLPENYQWLKDCEYV